LIGWGTIKGGEEISSTTKNGRGGGGHHLSNRERKNPSGKRSLKRILISSKGEKEENTSPSSPGEGKNPW